MYSGEAHFITSSEKAGVNQFGWKRFLIDNELELPESQEKLRMILRRLQTQTYKIGRQRPAYDYPNKP